MANIFRILLESPDKRKAINQGRKTYNFPRNRVVGRLETILRASHKRVTLRLTATKGNQSIRARELTDRSDSWARIS